MTTGEFIAELQNRGFDGFDSSTLVRFINWGGRFVANKTRARWEQATWDFTLAPGDYAVTLASMAGLKSVDHVYVTTDGFRKKLAVMSEGVFFGQWLPKSLAASDSRGEPYSYYTWNNQLFIIPPPTSNRALTVHGRKRWVNLDSAVPGGTPVTPEDLDEAIVLAALIRCHQRANETDQASELRIDLEEFLNLVADEEENLLNEEQERTQKDDSWA